VKLVPEIFYFPAGGAAVQHIAAPGEVTLARLTRKNGKYWMAIAPAEFLAFPKKKALAKSQATTGEWPHAFTKLKVPPERFIATYSSNHIHGVYGDYVEELKWVCKILNMEAEIYV
jgi:L-fucose isomerase